MTELKQEHKINRVEKFGQSFNKNKNTNRIFKVAGHYHPEKEVKGEV